MFFFFRVELKGGGGEGESSLIFFFISVIGTILHDKQLYIHIYVYDITAHAGLVIILLYEHVNNFIIMICACIQRRQNEITFIFTSVKRKYFRTIITSTDETDFTGHVFRAIQPVPSQHPSSLVRALYRIMFFSNIIRHNGAVYDIL